MNAEIKKICEQIAALPYEDCATQIVCNPVLRGELGIRDLQALASYALRVEKMLKNACRVSFWEGDELIRDHPTGEWWFDGFSRYPDALSAFEAIQTAE